MSQTKSQLIEGSAASELTAAKTLLGAGSAGAPSLTATGDTNTGIFFPTADTLAASTAGSERLRITSAGLVGIGVTSPGTALHLGNSSTLRINNPDGTRTLDLFNDASNAEIKATVDPIRINAFHSTAYVRFDTNNQERARITSAGLVGIGTTSPGDQLTVYGNGANIRLQTAGTSLTNSIDYYEAASRRAFLKLDSSPGELQIGTVPAWATCFYTNNAERARLDSSGAFMVGCTVRPSSGNVTGVFSEPGIITIGSTTSAGQDRMRFETPSGRVGSISTSGSGTAYNTSSDYRLKENVVPLTGAADRLSKLQVHRFNFIADPDTTVDGFLAHEAQAIVPECVTGAKDAVDADGNPVHQGIDQSKLVPLLTAALQEAVAEIKALKDRVTALESE